jgi:hypothetical protein
MEERRRLKRHHIMFYSRVFDRKTGTFLGYLGNLTAKGAMVIADEPLPAESDLQLRIDLPEDMYPKPLLNFKARSVWCNQDVDPNFYNIGFELFDVPEEDVKIIEQIVQDYGLLDPVE